MFCFSWCYELRKTQGPRVNFVMSENLHVDLCLSYTIRNKQVELNNLYETVPFWLWNVITGWYSEQPSLMSHGNGFIAERMS